MVGTIWNHRALLLAGGDDLEVGNVLQPIRRKRRTGIPVLTETAYRLNYVQAQRSATRVGRCTYDMSTHYPFNGMPASHSVLAPHVNESVCAVGSPVGP